MIVRFGLDLDDNPWPGPLGERDAVAGAPWVGPLGMLSLLETQLGLTGLRASPIHRAAALVPAVAATRGFWSESAEHDPLGVALELLRWRDELRLHGWAGASLALRLEALADVTAAAAPGVPERLDAVAAALAEQPVDIERVELLGTARTELPLLWRRVLDTLAARGVAIADAAMPAATQAGDLLHWRREGFDPAGDGSMELIRPEGPVSAAEQVAAWLAARPDLGRTVIIGADETLDLALAGAGLPATGAATDAGDEPLLQVLPLVMELAWSPPDPQLALELLLLPVGPVRRGVARGLARALHEWPAVDSDRWRAALEERLAGIDEAQQAGVRERIDLIFHRAVAGDHIDANAVRARIRSLVTWLQGNLKRDDIDDEDPWKAALTQCTTLRDLVDAGGRDRLSRPELQRLVEFATAACPRRPLRDAQAGLAAAGRPGSVLGPARCIVWWSFNRRSAAPARPLPLAPAERAALAAAGAPLPDPGALAVRMAERWRRPLEQAEERLLLVCPRTSESGDAEHPHPVWDEVTAGLGAARMAKLEHAAPAALECTCALPPLPTPRPRETWTVPANLVDVTVRNSPSSIGGLAGCSLQWVLERAGKARAGLVEPLPAANLLKGKVAHRILELLLRDPPPGHDPDAAAARARALFDAEVPRLAAEYFQPGREPLLQEVRQHTVDTARAIARLLGSVNAEIDDVEAELSATCDGIILYGYADLVLRTPRAVIDFKWGSAARHYTAIRDGHACQLASYARLVSGGGPVPPVGYFITSRQEMLTASPDLFPGIDAIDGVSPAETWAALRDAVSARLEEMRRGEVHAPGATLADPDKEKCSLDGGTLAMAPPCKYCNYRPLCRGEA